MKVLLTLMFGLMLSSAPQTDSLYTKAELLGKVTPSNDPNFTKIDKTYTGKENIYMRKEAYTAFKKMYYDAKSCGIDLQIVSAMRTFDHQKSIWDRKWARERYQGMSDKQKALDILTYSSMPGTSRHHWGTDLDFVDLNNKFFETGAGKHIYTWLIEGAAEYGFYQTYTPKDQGRTGYNEEKWHWTYLPVSQPMLRAYKAQITYDDISGFYGAELAQEIGMISNYVEGINPDLLD